MVFGAKKGEERNVTRYSVGQGQISLFGDT